MYKSKNHFFLVPTIIFSYLLYLLESTSVMFPVRVFNENSDPCRGFSFKEAELLTKVM